MRAGTRVQIAAGLAVVMLFWGCGEGSRQDTVGGGADTARAPLPLRSGGGLPTPPDSSHPAGSIGAASESQVIGVTLAGKKATVAPDSVGPGQVTLVIENQGRENRVFEMTAAGGGRWRSLVLAPGRSQSMTLALPLGDYTIFSLTPDQSAALVGSGKEAILQIR